MRTQVNLLQLLSAVTKFASLPGHAAPTPILRCESKDHVVKVTVLANVTELTREKLS